MFDESEQPLIPVKIVTVQEPGTFYIIARDAGRCCGTANSSTELYTLIVTLETNDSHEFNNNFETASFISAEETITATIGAPLDNDYFIFEVTSSGPVRTIVTNVPSNLSISLFLYGPTQQLIDDDRFNDVGEAIDRTFNLTTPGKYYVRLVSTGGFSNKFYQLTVSGNTVGTAPAALPGDVGNNGVVDAGDASLVLQSVVGLRTLNGTQRLAADVDANSAVQAADASRILQFVVGMISALKSGSDAATEATIAWGTAAEEADGSWRLPLLVDGDASAVYAAEMTLDFDPTALQIADFASALPADWLVLTAPDDAGRFRIAAAGATPLASKTLGSLLIHPIDSSRPVTLTGTALLNAGTASPLGDLQLATLPEAYALHPNYPNPFNPTTRLSFDLPEADFVTLRIYNLLGQPVATLVDREQPAGRHEVVWDASGMASGAYLYRLEAGGFVRTRVLTILR